MSRIYAIILFLLCLLPLSAGAVIDQYILGGPAAEGPSVDGLHMDDNYTANWSAITEIRVFEETTGTEKLDGLTAHAGATTNDFSTSGFDNGEYTSTSSHASGAGLWRDDNLDNPHWSENASSEIDLYAKWSAAFNLDYVDVYIDDGNTYGAGATNVDWTDRTPSPLTPISEPLHKDDYVAIHGVNTRQYRYKFIDDGEAGTLSATYDNSDPATGYDLTETNEYRFRDGDYNSSAYTSTATNADGFICMDFGSSVSVSTIYTGPTTHGSWVVGHTDRNLDYTTDAACGNCTSGSWTNIKTVSGSSDGVTQSHAVSITARCVRIGQTGGYLTAVGEFYAK